MVELQCLTEQGFRKQHPGEQGQTEQHEAGTEDAKQQCFHGEQRRQGQQTEQAGEHAALGNITIALAPMQLSFLQGHEQGMDGGNGEQAVGRHAKCQMNAELQAGGIGRCGHAGEQCRQRRA